MKLNIKEDEGVRMRMKRLIVAVLTMCLLASGMLGNTYIAKAEPELGPKLTSADEKTSFVVKPGETTHMHIPIRATDYYIIEALAKIEDKNTDSPFVFSKVKLTSSYGVDTDTIMTTNDTYADFDVTVKETAGIKAYPVSLVVNGIYYGYDPMSCTAALDLVFNIREEKAPAQLTVDDLFYQNATPGNNIELKFSLNNEGEIAARNTYMNITYGDTGISKNYTAENMKIGDIGPGNNKLVTLPVSISPTAGSGKKTLVANFSYKDIDGNAKTSTYNIMINIEANEEGPYIDIDDISYPDDLKQGDDFTLTAVLHNYGEAKADEVLVSVENTETDGIIKNFIADTIKADDVKKDGTTEVKIPLTVGATVSGNLNKLNLKLTYKDSMGVPYTRTKTLYIEVTSPEATKEPTVIISNVSQKPSQPVAGGDLQVSFDFQNKGPEDITGLKISLGNLTGATFIPVNTEPYIYIEKLNAGDTKRITIPLKVSEDIPEGLNNLTINYTYNGNKTGTDNIPVLDVKNDMGSNSTPKLIISKYVTDVPELRAGKTFNFTFDIYNTHSSVSAKNITVTVTQAENVFSVTQGSNSFFIERINPGETVQENLELKVKSDTKTGAYKLHIEVEYEYDGIKPKENGDVGITRTYDLNLQAVENAKPVVDYVNVYSMDGNVVVGNPAMLSFEFYNMGKSALNNVVATVEGDFVKSDGNMYFIGNVTEGSSMYAEFEVIPNMEGQAKGTLVVTYEDSNGDPVEYRKEFEAPINGAQIFDPGVVDGGVDVFNPAAPVAKKPIVPLWIFIIIEIAIFAIFLPVTRKVIISVHRKKLQKREDEKY
jgi:hypothetical protein